MEPTITLITDCSECPCYSERHRGKCVHPEGIRDLDNYDTPPPWCPLRRADLVLRLAPSAAGKGSAP